MDKKKKINKKTMKIPRQRLLASEADNPHLSDKSCKRINEYVVTMLKLEVMSSERPREKMLTQFSIMAWRSIYIRNGSRQDRRLDGT